MGFHTIVSCWNLKSKLALIVLFSAGMIFSFMQYAPVFLFLGILCLLCALWVFSTIKTPIAVEEKELVVAPSTHNEVRIAARNIKRYFIMNTGMLILFDKEQKRYILDVASDPEILNLLKQRKVANQRPLPTSYFKIKANTMQRFLWLWLAVFAGVSAGVHTKFAIPLWVVSVIGFFIFIISLYDRILFKEDTFTVRRLFKSPYEVPLSYVTEVVVRYRFLGAQFVLMHENDEVFAFNRLGIDNIGNFYELIQKKSWPCSVQKKVKK